LTHTTNGRIFKAMKEHNRDGQTKTVRFKVEAFDLNGYQRGLAHETDSEKAEWLASEWRKFRSFSLVTVSEVQET
jgi:hypothetical protein